MTEEKINLYKFEEELIDDGITYIAGCDEAGRGPIAGPVVVAACILHPTKRIEGLNDSKQLSAKTELCQLCRFHKTYSFIVHKHIKFRCFKQAWIILNLAKKHFPFIKLCFRQTSYQVL